MLEASAPSDSAEPIRCFQRRGCPLIGIYGSPDLQAQQARFTEHHWQQAWSVDMDTVYARHIDPKDKQRYGLSPDKQPFTSAAAGVISLMAV